MNLIERIEGAEGPSRELDAEIALTQGWSELPGDNWCGPEAQIAVPRYTASLDAAMSLVPEGCKWQISTEEPGPWAWVGVPGSDIPAIMAATPALALVAAALRAIGDTHDDT